MWGTWRETPDTSNDISSAPKSLSSPKEDASDERYLSESRNSCTGWLLPSPNTAATHFPQPWAHLQLTLPIPNTMLLSPMPPVSKSTNPCPSLSLTTRSLFNVNPLMHGYPSLLSHSSSSYSAVILITVIHLYLSYPFKYTTNSLLSLHCTIHLFPFKSHSSSFFSHLHGHA